MANDAGYQTDFCYMDQVGFLEHDGIFNAANNTRFDYWFKLYPWEDIALQTDGIINILEEITRNTSTVTLNPAYTLLFQSKGMLKVLYDLFPTSPYLLETKFEPLKGKKYVSKKMFGREAQMLRFMTRMGKSYINNPANMIVIAVFTKNMHNILKIRKGVTIKRGYSLHGKLVA